MFDAEFELAPKPSNWRAKIFDAVKLGKSTAKLWCERWETALIIHFKNIEPGLQVFGGFSR
jgi:hypothetical protein